METKPKRQGGRGGGKEMVRTGTTLEVTFIGLLFPNAASPLARRKSRRDAGAASGRRAPPRPAICCCYCDGRGVGRV